MKATLFLVLAMFLTLSVSESHARTPKRDPQLEETIQSGLSHGRHEVPSSFWRDLGPRAPIILVRMYTETHHHYMKARLVSVLGNYDTPEVAAFLRETAQSSMDPRVRAAAIRALGHSQGMREEAFFARALKSANPHTRLAAAEALMGTGDRKARLLVDNYVKGEKASWVVARLKRN